MKKILFAIAALAMTLTASASDDIKVAFSLSQPLVAGGTATLTCTESDVDNYTAVQMTIKLPEGVDVVLNDDDEEITGTDRWQKYHSASWNRTTGIMILDNSKNKEFLAAEGDLFTIELKAADDFKGGNIEVSNMKFVMTTYATYKPADISLPCNSTGVEAVNADVKANEPAKYVENGAVVIVKGDKKFNAAGAQVK